MAEDKPIHEQISSAEKLKRLKTVPVERIRGLTALIVDIPIGELSLKDSHRTIYVLGSTLVKAQEATNRVAEVFEKRELGIKKLIEKYEEYNSADKEEVLKDLKQLLVVEQPKPSETVKS